jgi:hypothetical protein
MSLQRHPQNWNMLQHDIGRTRSAPRCTPASHDSLAHDYKSRALLFHQPQTRLQPWQSRSSLRQRSSPLWLRSPLLHSRALAATVQCSVRVVLHPGLEIPARGEASVTSIPATNLLPWLGDVRTQARHLIRTIMIPRQLRDLSDLLLISPSNAACCRNLDNSRECFCICLRILAESALIQ